MRTKKVELLAPAKNAEYGKIAINFGADAVYIGAPKFSARASAGNSVADIADLCNYAHRFHAKVFVALNTILYENELKQTESLIWELYNAGADAIIIQDHGILEMNLPPIALHSSTQAHNTFVEKIRFLQEIGFSRVVLARELSLQKITEIAEETKIELEVFVHGALCVSYSGQCYMSAYIGNRSGNRGECAQSCRLPFDLTDSEGKKIISNKHVLSLKDMNRAEQIDELIKSGVTSFKIEGRMKDSSYLKNTVAFYRLAIDKVLRKYPTIRKTSLGKLQFDFEPDPEITFNRGFSNYFLKGRKADIHSVETPKSKGKKIGKVISANKLFFTVETDLKINNGDGLCFLDKNSELVGLRAEKVEKGKVFSLKASLLKPGVELFRNYDHAFAKKLDKISQQRYIDIDMIFCESENGFELIINNEESGIETKTELKLKKEAAKNEKKAVEMFRKQLSKTGGTNFKLRNFMNKSSGVYFVQAGKLNEFRRKALNDFDEALKKAYKREAVWFKPNSVPYFSKSLNYKANVSNSLAEKFYKRHGVEKLEKAFELLNKREDKELMTTKMCLKFYLGMCENYQNAKPQAIPKYLVHKNQEFSLNFDCKNCVMTIKS